MNGIFRLLASASILVASCTFMCLGNSFANAYSTSNKDSYKEHENMALVPSGTFWMGCNEPVFTDALPIHKVRLKSFWLDKTEVTNEQFKKFVDETGYITVAECSPKQEEFPNVPQKNLVAGSLVFVPPKNKVSLSNHYQWWQYIPGANWQHPEGPQSSVRDRMSHPVVHIAWEDALAYAKWMHKRLPTEAEFEYAARGGLDRNLYSWGNELKPKGKIYANLWQGNFPNINTEEDGYFYTAPVASFPANGYGLYDMTGNVWQWCSDWYGYDYYQKCAKQKITINPSGPINSFDPKEPNVKKKVQKGGSFLCNAQYCARFLVGARGKGEINSSASHIGFRCAQDI